MRKNKIGKKLLIFLWLLICIPLFVVSFIFSRMYSKSLQESIKVSSIQTLNAVNMGFDNFLNNLSQQIDVISKNDAFKSSNVENNTSQIENIIYDAKKSTKNILDIYYAVENSDLKIESNKYERTNSYKNQTWYKEAKTNSNIVFSEPYFKPEIARTVITISKRIINDNTIAGVIAMDIDMATVKDYIATINLSSTGYLILINEDGQIIANNIKNDILENDISSIEFYDDILANKSGFYEWNNDIKPVYILDCSIAQTGWKMLGIIDKDEVISKLENMNMIILIAVVICLIISMILSLLLSNFIINKVKTMKSFMKQVSIGNLSCKMNVTSNDEIGDLENSFNIMNDKIRNLIKNISLSSNKLLNAAENINGMSEETTAAMSQVSEAVSTVANGATLEASNMQFGIEQIDKLSDKMNNIDDQILSAGELSNKANELSNEGLDMVDDLISNSILTKKNYEEYILTVNDMISSINSIHDISNSILEISKGSNLLSLNAAIEAQRAGEKGKGFAVVASEIRKLCTKTVKCTNDIQSIISDLNKKMKSTEEAMNKSIDMFKKQDVYVNQTKSLFNDIAQAINLLFENVNKMQNINKDMKIYKSDVKMKMDDISLISEETASIAEEVSASAEEVNSTMEELTAYALNIRALADKLDSEISQFKI